MRADAHDQGEQHGADGGDEQLKKRRDPRHDANAIEESTEENANSRNHRPSDASDTTDAGQTGGD